MVGNFTLPLAEKRNSGVSWLTFYLSEEGPILCFLGKSLEIIPQGTTHLKIGQDHFEW